MIQKIGSVKLIYKNITLLNYTSEKGWEEVYTYSIPPLLPKTKLLTYIYIYIYIFFFLKKYFKKQKTNKQNKNTKQQINK